MQKSMLWTKHIAKKENKTNKTIATLGINLQGKGKSTETV